MGRVLLESPFKLIYRGELAFVSYFLQQLDTQAAAVEVSVEIEDAGLKQSAAAVHRGTNPDIGHGSVHSAVDLHARGVDSVFDIGNRSHIYIGRRETHAAPQLLSVNNFALYNHTFSVSLRTSDTCEKNSLAKTLSTV